MGHEYRPGLKHHPARQSNRITKGDRRYPTSPFFTRSSCSPCQTTGIRKPLTILSVAFYANVNVWQKDGTHGVFSWQIRITGPPPQETRERRSAISVLLRSEKGMDVGQVNEKDLVAPPVHRFCPVSCHCRTFHHQRINH